jgi:hypothetical protein
MNEKTHTIHRLAIRICLLILPTLMVIVHPANPEPALAVGPGLIDPFTAGQCAGPNCVLPQPVVADPTILGSERDVLAGAIAGTSALRVWGAAWPGLSVENGPPDGLSTFLVVWDGPDGDETVVDYTGLGADLLAGCAPGGAYFELHQAYLDRKAAYTVTVYTDEDHWSSWSSGIVDQSDVVFQVPLGDFPAGAGDGADWHDVGAISLAIDTSVETTADLSLAPFHFGCTPTAVDLARFEASRQGSAVRVEWETVSEVDTLGFHLYRQAVEGERVRLNAALIPTQVPGSPDGAVYTWLDEEAWPGRPYCYWLEDVDVYSLATLHGPACVEGHTLTLRRGPCPPVH